MTERLRTERRDRPGGASGSTHRACRGVRCIPGGGPAERRAGGGNGALERSRAPVEADVGESEQRGDMESSVQNNLEPKRDGQRQPLWRTSRVPTDAQRGHSSREAAGG